MWAFFQHQILCLLNGGVPWIEVSQRRGSTVFAIIKVSVKCYYLCVLLWPSLNVTVFCLLQKHLFKGMWNFQQNYCHACQTRFPKSLLLLKSSCVRSLLFIEWPASKDLITTPLLVNLAHLNTHMVERVSLTSCRLTVWSKLNFIYLPKCGWQFPCNMPELFRLFKR